MRKRRAVLCGFILVGALCGLFLAIAPDPAQAVPRILSDTVRFVFPSGPPLDFFIFEDEEPLTIFIGPIVVPIALLPDPGSFFLPCCPGVVLTEPGTGGLFVSDGMVLVEAFGENTGSSTAQFSASFSFASDGDPGIATSTPPGFGSIEETGDFQDVTSFLFPSGITLGSTTIDVPFRVLIRSDVEPVVPEPATLLLLGSGLVGLAAWRWKPWQ